MTTITDANGGFSFANLPPGTYRVREVNQTGWVQTTVNPSDITLVSGVTVHGASFGNEAHLAGPFDMLTAPNAAGFFVGDYEALDTSGTTFKPFFVQANSGNTSNRTDVFATTVTP